MISRVSLLLTSIVILVALSATPGRAPRQTTAPVREFDRTMTSLVAGSLVLVAFDYAPAERYELQPIAERVLRQAKERGARVATVSLRPQGPLLAQQALDAVYGREAYGDAVVNLGFVEGGLAAALAAGNHLGRTFPRDHFGGRVRGLGQPALLVSLTSGSPGALEWLLAAEGRGLPKMIAASSSIEAPRLVPFVDSGQLAGHVDGLPGLAQLEPAPVYGALPLLLGAFVAALVAGNLAPLALGLIRRRRAAR